MSICYICTYLTYVTPATIYKKTEYGKLCRTGTVHLRTENQCQSAAFELGLTWASAWNGPGDFPGCFHANDGRNKVYFNLASNPSSVANNPNYAAICLIASK